MPRSAKAGTLALSWGPSGGVYVFRGFCWRICLGPLALTYVPVEVDDLMHAYGAGEFGPPLERESCGRLLVGQGNDTYDPMCILPRGHDGSCRPEAAA